MLRSTLALLCFSVSALPAAQLPLAFERNQGQAASIVRYLARTSGYAVFLSSDAVAVDSPSARFRMRFAGAALQSSIEALEPLPGKSNYLVGRNPRDWHTGIATYGSVRYGGIYRGVDLIFHASEAGQLEYDFHVAPGADPRAIRLAFDGARPERIDADGNLVLTGIGGQWLQHKPRVYQGRQTITGQYKLLSGGLVGFEVAKYDRSKPLVIDPVLTYATYFGGNLSQVNTFVIDEQGNVYMTGTTSSASFPVTASTYDTAFPGSCPGGSCSQVAFVAKLNNTATGLIYSTFIGGTGGDSGSGIAIDLAGDVYLTGTTRSANFPVTSNALRKTLAASSAGDGFLVKLDPAGQKLLYGSYLGGGTPGTGGSLALSPSGSLFVAGQTQVSGFPILNALQPQTTSTNTGFIMQWRTSDMVLLYSTFFGGSGIDNITAMTLDSGGNVYVTGSTNSKDFPLVNAIQSKLGGGNCTTIPAYPPQPQPCSDAFVSKISSDGKHVLYSTLWGGEGADAAQGIAVDPAGEAYILGATNSLNLPADNAVTNSLQVKNCGSPGAVYAPLTSCSEGFVLKLNAAGNGVSFSTYLDANPNLNAGSTIAIAPSGNVYVAATAPNPIPTDLPLISAPMNACSGGLAGSPAAIVSLRPDGTLAYSALFGGTATTTVSSILLDDLGNLYMAGWTNSGDYPASPGVYQPALASSTSNWTDGFLAKINLTYFPSPGITLAPACVVNAASYMNWMTGVNTPSGSVSPGEIISIFGSGIGPMKGVGAVADSAGRLPTSLEGVTVTFDGIAAPLLYVQANQVNALVPFEVAGKAQTIAQLQFNGAMSNTAPILVGDVVPGIFTVGAMGKQVAAVNQDGTLNSASNPATKGSIVSVWATGFGPLSQSYPDGQIVTGALGTLGDIPVITVNGVPAQIKYKGQAPDLVAGTIQINLVIPDGAISGANPVCIGACGPVMPTIAVQ